MRRRIRVLGSAVMTASLVILMAMPVAAAGAAHSRPFSDWTSAQTPLDTTIPVELSVIWWYEAGSNESLIVDMDGRVAAWIVANGGQASGPRLSGTVTERVLPDGRAEVTVQETIRNAITYAWLDANDFADFPDGPKLFGYRSEEIAQGAMPALSNASFGITFIVPNPGAPLPDFAHLAFAPDPGQEIVFSHFSSVGHGPLRSGSGYADGTSGMASTEQIGNFRTSGGGATADGFPVEHVSVRPSGH